MFSVLYLAQITCGRKTFLHLYKFRHKVSSSRANCCKAWEDRLAPRPAPPPPSGDLG